MLTQVSEVSFVQSKFNLCRDVFMLRLFFLYTYYILYISLVSVEKFVKIYFYEFPCDILCEVH